MKYSIEVIIVRNQEGVKPDQNNQKEPPVLFTGLESVVELQEKIIALHQDNKHLRRANSRLKNEVRRKDKTINRMREEGIQDNRKKKKSNKQYKNGKRGTKFNG